MIEWERIVILELNREHGHVTRTHKVNLRPVLITLFDSERLWGQYDNSTRTISLSRKLISEHPWEHVLGVLHHEMAHQLVAEEGQLEAERPHGAAFKEACLRLGVPAQFSRAGLDLQSCLIDWRTDARDESSIRILDRVKKLLALANSTNEHEALLAMERVRELYARYNLEHMESLSRESFVHLVITSHKKKMMAWEQRTISILTEHFFVKVLTFQQFEAQTGKHVHALEVIGTRENVLMAEYVYHFLLTQVEALLKAAASNPGGLERAARTSFRLGVLDGFAKKLKGAEKTGTAPTPIGVALEKFRGDPHLESYIGTIYPRLRRGRSSSISYHSGAFAAGHAAGKSITLNKPITTQMGNRGRILSRR